MEKLKDRPAYVRFDRKPVEDRAASIKAGNTQMRDVDYVSITAVGTKDEVVREVAPWLAHIKQQVTEGRLPPEHEEYYRKAYERWKAGEEVPLQGTPIKHWPVISPAQMANCLAANVRTVEDLAQASGEAITRIGMGAVELKQKAEAWLKASASVGTVVQLNSALQVENARLKTEVAALEKKNEELANRLLKYEPRPAPQPVAATA